MTTRATLAAVPLAGLLAAALARPADPPYGLDKRVPLTTSTVVGSPDPPPPYRVKRVYPNFSPAFPIMAKAVPGTGQLLLITEVAPYGKTALHLVKDDPAARTEDAVKLMDTPDGGVAYDFAFHPRFADNGHVYVGWNSKAPGAEKHFTRVTRYTMGRTPPYAIDPKSGRLVIEWESNGHNGGAVCFGTDGMLYVTSGDGTSDSDGNLMGQRTDSLLAKLLRLDVDHPADDKPYSVPKDNPFVADKRFVPETWAYGLRNPWRVCCDEKTGHIWVGNNGQDLWETAYLIRKGANYGWSVVEGSHEFYPNRKAGPTPFARPTVEHHHSEARSLTGGVVYHGDRLPELRGAYIYGDYSTGRIWGIKHDGTKPLWHKELATPRMQITAFGTDSKGELLICDHRGSGEGGLYTLEPTPMAAPSTFPRKLSDSGLFDSVRDHAMKPGVVPYSVNAPFWSDGMHKDRWIALPAGESIAYTRARGWNFPDRTVIVKSFALPDSRKWIETRFFTKQNGEWFGYTYVWNEAGTDAELVPAGGLDKEFTVEGRKQVWHYPSRAECMVCHSRAQNFVLGLCTAQMNRDHDYGGRTDNQLRTLDHLGMLKVDWAAETRAGLAEQAAAKGLKDKAVEEYVKAHTPPPDRRPPQPDAIRDLLPRLVDPYDAKQDLTRRARSWLHANCSACHVAAGGGNALMELEAATAADKMRVLGEKPLHSTFGLPDARLIAPGHPDRSVILKRVGMRGSGQMPPLSTNRPDEAGLNLLREWVAALKE